MEKFSIRQALRNAIESEQASSDFYRSLKEYTDNESAQSFFDEMAEKEQEHKRQIEEIWRTMDAAALPDQADREVDFVETVSIWKNADEISYEDALVLAKDAENNAELFYSALADQFEGNDRETLLKIAEQEADHARWLATRIKEYADKS